MHTDCASSDMAVKAAAKGVKRRSGANPRSLKALSKRMREGLSEIPQGYLDDFLRYSQCMQECYTPDCMGDAPIAYPHWWTGSGASGTRGAGPFVAGVGELDADGVSARRDADGPKRLMPPFDLLLVEDLFLPWLLKFYQRQDLTPYEYAINFMFAREDRRFVKGSGDPPWLGADFDRMNTKYKSLRATLNDEDGVVTSSGGASRLKESTIPWLLKKAGRQWLKLEEPEPNQAQVRKLAIAFGETMGVLTGLTLMARSNSSGGIGPEDIAPKAADGSITIKVAVWARKGKRKAGTSRHFARHILKRIPAGGPVKGPGGIHGLHPRDTFIDLLDKLRSTYAMGGGLPTFSRQGSAKGMTALIRRVLGGKTAAKACMFDPSQLPSSHTLRKTGATMAERSGAPREGRFLRWGEWDDPRAIQSYVAGTWEGSGFSRLYFDWLVDASI